MQFLLKWVYFNTLGLMKLNEIFIITQPYNYQIRFDRLHCRKNILSRFIFDLINLAAQNAQILDHFKIPKTHFNIFG